MVTYVNKTGNHWNVGQDNPNARLNEMQVDKIKELCGYMSNVELARAYGISDAQVSRIRNEIQWSHL